MFVLEHRINDLDDPQAYVQLYTKIYIGLVQAHPCFYARDIVSRVVLNNVDARATTTYDALRARAIAYARATITVFRAHPDQEQVCLHWPTVCELSRGLAGGQTIRVRWDWRRLCCWFMGLDDGPKLIAVFTTCQSFADQAMNHWLKLICADED